MTHQRAQDGTRSLWMTTSHRRRRSEDFDQDTTRKSALERSSSSVARGPRRPKLGHDRLMDSLHQPANPRPALCPTCGRPAIAEGITTLRGVNTNHCTDERGHIWIVRWMVAA